MGNQKSYVEVLRWASSFLEGHGKEAYAAEYLLLSRLGWSKTDWLLHLQEQIPAQVEIQLRSDVAKIMEDIPAQYLLGFCEFYGEQFSVTEDTLIPRPETEELVALCLENTQTEQLKVVDIGTGTGAIGITLQKLRPTWQVSAGDISAEALEVAKKNATCQNVTVDFRLGHLLEPFYGEKFDVIISNPPYIGVEEWAEMDASVRQYEPKLALFAENHGLEIYQKLAEQAPSYLKEAGKLFLEIGYRQGEAVSNIFQEAFPSKKVILYHDLSGQERMIIVE